MGLSEPHGQAQTACLRGVSSQQGDREFTARASSRRATRLRGREKSTATRTSGLALGSLTWRRPHGCSRSGLAARESANVRVPPHSVHASRGSTTATGKLGRGAETRTRSGGSRGAARRKPAHRPQPDQPSELPLVETIFCPVLGCRRPSCAVGTPSCSGGPIAARVAPFVGKWFGEADLVNSPPPA